MKCVIFSAARLEPLLIVKVPDEFRDRLLRQQMSATQVMSFGADGGQATITFERLNYNSSFTNCFIIILHEPDVAEELLAGEIEPFTEVFDLHVGNKLRPGS